MQSKHNTEGGHYGKRSLEVALAEGGAELTSAINAIQNKYGLPACLLEGLLTNALAGVREVVRDELTRAYASQQQEREQELVKQFTKESAEEKVEK